MLSEDRRGRITASEVGAILQLSPYRTAEDVMRSMVRQWFGAEKEFSGNVATRYGKKMEPVAIAAYAEKYGPVEKGEFVIHPLHDWLGATPDGFTILGEVLEVKCPFSQKLFELNDKPFYAAQVQIQMQCCDRKSAVFVVWTPGLMATEQVKRDDDWFQSVLPMIKAFHDRFLAIVDDFELSGTYLADKEREVDSEEWGDAADKYRQASIRYEAAKTDLDIAKAGLIDLAEGRKSRGAGVLVYPIAGRQTVDYKKAVTDLCQGADLSGYSKVGAGSWGVKLENGK